MSEAEQIKAEILRLTRRYTDLVHRAHLPGWRRSASEIPARVPYAARVFDAEEVAAGVESLLDFWLTLGPEGDRFEAELAAWLGVRHVVLVNSGSSANLLAVAALTSDHLGERRLRPGDEVITAAAGFPTTVAPLVQHGLVPVFLDCDPLTLNPRVEQLDEAYRPGITKAVMLAHTLGNPFDLGRVTAFCERHGLWLIEDNCDALGSLYDERRTGTFGDLSTQSFYPPHHLTLGEGGSVNVPRTGLLRMLVRSFRDWGRDCWCPSGVDNTCRQRFGWQLGDLPAGYDHKYTYRHLGYNLKPLDPQAAIGRAQLAKLPSFIAARQAHWDHLRAGLAPLEEHLDFMLPTHATRWDSSTGFTWDESGHRTRPSWFGFMLAVKPSAPFQRSDLVRSLEAAGIDHRMLFGGNLVRQPAFVQLRRDAPHAFRTVGDLSGADRILHQALFVGVYPGLTTAMLDRVVEAVTSGVRRF